MVPDMHRTVHNYYMSVSKTAFIIVHAIRSFIKCRVKRLLEFSLIK